MSVGEGVKTHMTEDKTLVLGAQFTQHELDSMFECMTERSLHNGPVRIDGRHVEYVDVASIQVLSAFVSYTYSWINGPVWVEPSAYLLEVTDLLGVASFLGLTESKDLLVTEKNGA